MMSTMVSTREVPWMKLGKLADKPMTAAEAAEAGGLNFTVEKRDLFFATQHDGMQPVGDRAVIVRTDTQEPLGIMSKDYPILQFREAFDFMDTVNPTYVAAGALRGGRQGFLVVKAPTQIAILDGEDPHDMYMVLRTSHDGTRAVEVSIMPLRQRCMNQLALNSFSRDVPHRWSIPHTSSMRTKLAEAQSTLQSMGRYAARFSELADKLACMHLTDDHAIDALTESLPDRPKRAEKIEFIINKWHTAETVGFDWSGWGLVNAVSEYFDWDRSSGTPESRFLGALQGSTRNTINRVTARLLTRSRW